MNHLLAFVVYYAIAVRTIVPCGDSVRGSSNVSFTCSEQYDTVHQVQFMDEIKALRFISNLAPYNKDGMGPLIMGNQKFITDLTVYTFTKHEGKWVQVSKHELKEN